MSFAVKSPAVGVLAAALLVVGCSRSTRIDGPAESTEDGATAAGLVNRMTTRQIEDVQVWLAERRLQRLSPARQAEIEALLAGEAERQRERATEAHQ